MPSIHDFVPSPDDLRRWRTAQVFEPGDVVKITRASESSVRKWFEVGAFRPGETFRIGTQKLDSGGWSGRRRFVRAGLIRLFRAHGMRQALINIGETPSCYAILLGPTSSRCWSIL